MSNNNTLSAAIKKHLKEFQQHLCGFLGVALPDLCATGSDWWALLVRSIPKLKGSQSSSIKAGTISDLRKLDLVSLCGVLRHNWHSICEKRGIEDHQRTGAVQCDTLINLRNILSHLGSENAFTHKDTLAALLCLKKLSMLLEAPGTLVDGLDSDIEKLGKLVSSENGSTVASLEPTDESPTVEVPDPPIGPVSDQGIPLSMLACEGETREAVEAALSRSTFVGIDFGTSTTTASRVYLDPQKGILTTEPIPIPQLDRIGRTIDDHLVPSCVSWSDDSLLIGHGAADLKSELNPGVDIWFSFKMKLGVDLGPEYTRSKLDGKEGRPEVRRPQDVAALFFRFLRERIETWVTERGLPGNIRYAVSVPASFEANQRLDLCRVMNLAGINIEDNSIIDEPNAAFVSHLLDTLVVGDASLKSFRDRPANILVFDFGAGTCDISVLHVGLQNDHLVSRNLAISQFRALGGDNIDRQIARKVLWPQMQRASKMENEHFRSIELDQVILPKLLSAAEQLKVQCCKWIDARAQGGDLSSYRSSDERVTVAPLPPMQVGGHRLELDSPSISLKDFFGIMAPFLGTKSSDTDPDLVSIFEPIENAMGKAGIGNDDLSMVLFIGGSAQNPLVQSAIREYFGRFVACVARPDMRTPVSRGAALHSLTWNGMKMQFIRPITSETVYILTRGKQLHAVIPAGSPIPLPEIVFTDGLIVPTDGQAKVELPICVSTASKILHVLELRPPRGRSFSGGDRITVCAQLDQNKLLHLTAKLGTVMTEASLINPLSNESLTPEETKRLIARQRLNESIVERGGKPDAKTLEEFAEACGNSGSHLEAAESFESLERIDPSRKTSENATRIGFHYSRCNQSALSAQWAETAHNRRPTWVSAFNLALARERSNHHDAALQLFEEALEMDSNNPTILAVLGERLLSENQPRAKNLLESARRLFHRQLANQTLDRGCVSHARMVGRILNDNDFLGKLDELEKTASRGDRPYSEQYLAASTNQENLNH